MVKRQRSTFGLALLLSAIALTALSGCAAKKTADTGPVFFPPPPNPPRIQYLTSFDDSTDIEGKKQSFSLFLLGGAEAEKVKAIGKPYGVLAGNGKIYVCDIGWGDVAIIDLARKTFEGLKGNYNLGKLKKPVNLTLDAEGNLYVADTARKDVAIYNKEGDFIAAYGKQLQMKPADVAVDDKFIYVLDVAGNDIKVLDRKNGKFLRTIGKRTETSEGLSIPTNLTLGADGFLYVTNIGTGQVMKLDRDGHVLSSFGQLGDVPTMFTRPKGIDVDEKGRIYVVDGGHQNIQVFNNSGRLLVFFGDPGLVKGSMNLPTGVSISKENLDFFQKFAAPSFILESLIFVTNQYGEDKLAVYGLGHREGDPPAPETAEEFERVKN